MTTTCESPLGVAASTRHDAGMRFHQITNPRSDLAAWVWTATDGTESACGTVAADGTVEVWGDGNPADPATLDASLTDVLEQVR